MKSKVKLGLIIVSALIFSASFGFVVGQILKDREAEKAFQSLSEQFSDTEPATSPRETEIPESLVSEETMETLSSDREYPLSLPVKKPRKAISRVRPEPVEESESPAPEEIAGQGLLRETARAFHPAKRGDDGPAERRTGQVVMGEETHLDVA